MQEGHSVILHSAASYDVVKYCSQIWFKDFDDSDGDDFDVFTQRPITEWDFSQMGFAENLGQWQMNSYEGM